MFRDNVLIPSGPQAATLPPSQPTLDEQLPIRLRDHLQRLRLILPVISVSVLALRQNAERDEEIATVLLRHAGDPLDMEIAKIEVLLDTLATVQRAKGVAA